MGKKVQGAQENLYAILDAIGLSATVGEGTLEMDGKIQIDNGEAKFSMRVTQLMRGILEIDNNLWVAVKAGDLGMVFKARDGALKLVILFDTKHKDCQSYIKSGDFRALLTHVTIERESTDWVVDYIPC